MKYSTKKRPRVYQPLSGFADFLPTLEARGERTLFEYPVKKEFVKLSSADFAKMIRQTAAGLSALGLAGKRVAVMGDTSPQWVASYLAIVAAGGVAIPMDKELDVTAIEGFLSIAEAEGIIYSASFHEKLAHARAEHPTLTTFISIGGAEDDKTLPFDALLAQGAGALEMGYTLPARDHDAPATMLFTSGTTGTSKCVVLAEKNTCACVNAACETVDFSQDDVILSVLPIHHTYELAIMLAAINLGLTIGINDSLRNLQRNIAHIRPTGLILVPLFVSTLYQRILTTAKKQGKDKMLKRMIPVASILPRSWRRKLFSSVHAGFGGRLAKIICGGAALNPVLVRHFDAFGIQICEGYGITECSPLIAVNPYFANVPGSVGPAVPSCKVRIAASGKNDLGFDEGEIQVKGDNVMLGYYRNEEANANAFTEDGWYRTGDVGYLDKKNYIHITGRMKSVIVLENGKNVFPEEIEEYLENIEEIAESVVVGRKAPDSDAVVLTAVVYPKAEAFPEGTDKDTMYKVIYDKIAEQNKHVASFKKILALELRDEEFEKTTSRKIKRHLVK